MTADDDFFDDDGEPTAVLRLSDLRSALQATQDRHLLVRVQGAQLGEVWRLGSETVHVGRSQESELWVTDDGVSRRHARLLPDPGGGYLIEDLESANGTFVQGERVSSRLLRNGDLVQIGPTAVFRYSITDENQETLLRKLYSASVTDVLTGAHKREHFDAQLARELSYARRHRRDCCILLLDLDHFKRLNDSYGHPAGDDVLSTVARAIQKELRTEDLLARFGGEEFAVILRGVGQEGAVQVAERLRSVTCALRIAHGEHLIQVALSAGVAYAWELKEPHPDELLALADRRLYIAKRSGRNRVVSSG